MSIVRIMRQAAADVTGVRDQSTAPPPPRRYRRGQTPDHPAIDAVGNLEKHIPTEAIAIYTAILPFLVAGDTPLDEQDYTARWILALAVGGSAILFAVGVYRRALRERGTPFRWPPRMTATALLAYAAWVCAIPGSPLQSFSWFTPAYGAVIGIGVAGLISLLHLWFGEPES